MSDVVLAEYFTTDELTLLFIVRADMAAPEIVKIETPRAEIRRFVTANFGPAGQGVRGLDVAAWQDLFEPFVAPILHWANAGDILWLVPHDALHYLPLHALRVDGACLIDRHPICYTPSASTMKYCQAKRKTNPERGAALVLGDSRGDLPFSRIEAARIAALLGCQPALGRAAAKSRVLAALADAAGRGTLDLLHLACHGYFDPDQPLKSSIVLAPNGDDGLLTAEELFGLQMRADLVTLSACESGVNERRPGDELIGLTRALIYAGTPSVLVSLWAVDDLSTALLMERFYAAWWGSPRGTPAPPAHRGSKAKALQAAQCWLRDLGRDAVLAYVVEAQDAAAARIEAGGDEGPWAERLFFRLDARRLALQEDYGPDDRPFEQIYYWAPFALVGDWA